MKVNPLWAVLGIVGLFVGAFVIAYVSANNTGNRMERGIEGSHEQGRNVLGQYAPRLREALGVTKIQASAVADVITKANEARYGKEGSDATVQWIQEQNPSLDQSNYRRVIDLIEAGRNDFQRAQQDKIDRLRDYKTALGNMPGSFFLSMAGYPTPGFLDKYEKIVVSGHTDEAFTTGRDDGVNLNGF